MFTPSLSSLIPQDLSTYLLSYLLTSTIIHILLPATILITTAPSSPLRYITILILAYFASLFVTPHPSASTLRITSAAQLVLVTVQAIHLLLIARLDDRALAREIPERALFKSDRLYHAVESLIQPRGVGTPREIKNIPGHPKYFASAKLKSGDKDKGGDSKAIATVIPRSKFLTRQILIFTWQYLALDVLQTITRQQALEGGGGGSSGFTHIDWFVPLEEWVERGLTNLVTWFVVSRIVIDIHYRFVSILFVGLGLDNPVNWPPAFGRMKDAYTIRKFWGTFWHQFLRGPFTAVSNFIARDFLHLARPSILERYTNMFIVFLLSGILHVMTDHIQSIPFEYSGAIIHFPITIFGIMFEDGVQELWKRVSPSANANSASALEKDSVPPLWQRIVGYVWTLLWLSVVSTWYFHPMRELPTESTTLVPVSLSEKVGVQSLGVVVLGAGLIGGYLFGAEI
ncbi:Acetyltransferase pyr8 [Penicillium rolfsii]|nr:Acetyltransferase pyr8 [Penicillium rolfsii]